MEKKETNLNNPFQTIQANKEKILDSNQKHIFFGNQTLILSICIKKYLGKNTIKIIKFILIRIMKNSAKIRIFHVFLF